MGNKIKYQLPKVEEVFGSKDNKQLEIFKRYGVLCAPLDAAIVMGSASTNNYVNGVKTLKNRTCWYWLNRGKGKEREYYAVNALGSLCYPFKDKNSGVVRPMIRNASKVVPDFKEKVLAQDDKVGIVKFGACLSNSLPDSLEKLIAMQYNTGSMRNHVVGRDSKYGLIYDIDKEYYCRVKSSKAVPTFKLSNGKTYEGGDYVWLKYAPIIWLWDKKSDTLVSRRGLYCSCYDMFMLNHANSITNNISRKVIKVEEESSLSRVRY